MKTLRTYAPTHLRTSRMAGQVMLITTLVLSGTILAASTIAGLLMLYQIRQAGNSAESAKAIFAADSGTEVEMYNLYFPDLADCSYTPSFDDPNTKIAEHFSEIDSSGNISIISKGVAGRTTRAFQVELGAFATSIPCSRP